MIAASEVLAVIEEALRPWEACLLFDMLRPDASLLTRWQGAVVRITGATTPPRGRAGLCGVRELGLGERQRWALDPGA